MKSWYDRVKIDLINNSEVLASKETTDEERPKAYKTQAELMVELDRIFDLMDKMIDSQKTREP